MADSTIDNLTAAVGTDLDDADLFLVLDGTNPPKKITRAELVKGLHGTGVAGDILYHNGTTWVRLAKGTALQKLQMNAGATAPEWATLSVTTGEWEYVEDIWDYATDGIMDSTAKFESSAFADGYDYAISIEDCMIASAVATGIEVEIYKETDAAYHGTVLTVISTSTSTTNETWGWLEFKGARVSRSIHDLCGWGGEGNFGITVGSDDGSDASGLGAIFRVWSLATAQKIGKIRVSGTTSVDWNNGTIRLYRKAL